VNIAQRTKQLADERRKREADERSKEEERRRAESFERGRLNGHLDKMLRELEELGFKRDGRRIYRDNKLLATVYVEWHQEGPDRELRIIWDEASGRPGTGGSTKRLEEFDEDFAHFMSRFL
jgi:hypothetical protein